MFLIFLHRSGFGAVFFYIMANFASIAESIISFNIEKSIQKFFNEKRVQDEIIRTIRKRLFKTGLEKDGKQVSTDRGTPYAGITTYYKKLGITKREGKTIFTGVRPTDRVTLLSEGHLYASMKSIVTKNQIALVANFDDPKYKGTIYKNFTKTYNSKKDFESEVMSLNDEEIKKLIDNLLHEVISEMKKEI